MLPLRTTVIALIQYVKTAEIHGTPSFLTAIHQLQLPLFQGQVKPSLYIVFMSMVCHPTAGGKVPQRHLCAANHKLKQIQLSRSSCLGEQTFTLLPPQVDFWLSSVLGWSGATARLPYPSRQPTNSIPIKRIPEHATLPCSQVAAGRKRCTS